MQKKNIPSVLAASISAATMLSLAVPVFAQGTGGLEEVFVTARKRDEGVQTVPLSIAAISGEALEQRGVRQLEDLNVVVPGFRFGAEGGKGNNNIVMRGMSKIPLGDGMSAVVTYINNVALPSVGANVPTFDIANIQVLKGPQGTLFGRNALGGAVQITSEAPNFAGVNGYLRGTYGTKSHREVEGAVNVPLVDDKLAMRIAGQVRRQDGLNNNNSGGPDFDNTHAQAYRVSFLFQPTDKIESTLIWDHFQANETSAALSLFREWPATLNAIAGSFNAALPGANVGTQWATQTRNFLALAKDASFHSQYSDLADGGSVRRHNEGITWDTTADVGFASVRNIFGYRRHDTDEIIDTPATGRMVINVPAFPGYVAAGIAGDHDFIFYHASAQRSRKFLSDELQLFGNAFDDKLDWIVGAFYNNDNVMRPNGSRSDRFYLQGVFPPASFVTANVENTNKALFGQIGYDLSDLLLDGLKFNAGVRTSWDEVYACGGGSDHFMGNGECEAKAKLNLPDGTGTINAKDHENSWTIGLDWQITPDTFSYVAMRHGYRGANVNTPSFETAYTTGGNVCGATANQPCPDLRPFQTVEPEKITDVEIGIKNDWVIGDVKGRANVAVFQSKYTKAVQFINAANLGIPSSAKDLPTNSSVGVNAADLTIRGVEADLTVIPVPSLTLTFSAAFTDQDIDKVTSPSANLTLTEREITLPSPDFSGTFAFNWTLPVNPLDGDLVFNGDYYKTTPFSGQGGENLPGYELTNFRLSWNGIAKSGLSAAVFLRNAFDKEYFSSPSVLLAQFPVSTALIGDPRTWGVEATYRF